jgi:hypothetical protein
MDYTECGDPDGLSKDEAIRQAKVLKKFKKAWDKMTERKEFGQKNKEGSCTWKRIFSKCKKKSSDICLARW